MALKFGEHTLGHKNSRQSSLLTSQDEVLLAQRLCQWLTLIKDIMVKSEHTYLLNVHFCLLKLFPVINMTLESDFFGMEVGVIENGTRKTNREYR